MSHLVKPLFVYWQILLFSLFAYSCSALDLNNYTFSISNDLASSLQKTLSNDAVCIEDGDLEESRRTKRADNNVVACLIADAQDTLFNIGQNNFAQHLIRDAAVVAAAPGGAVVPVLQDPAYQNAMSEVILRAADIIPSIVSAPTEDVLVAAGLVAFFSAFAVALEGASALAEFVVDQVYLVVGEEMNLCPFSDDNLPQCSSILCQGTDGGCTLPHLFSMCKCRDWRCPTDPEEELCPNDCGGDDGTLHCNGLSNGIWTVYDSREKLVGGPGTDSQTAGTPYSVGFWVDSPTNRDATNIRMSYPGDSNNNVQYKWSTGWTGRGEGSQSYTASYFCDDVMDVNSPGYWHSWTGPQRPGRYGFEREFNCWFRGWAGGDGFAGDSDFGSP